jgi:hypothetical protein
MRITHPALHGPASCCAAVAAALLASATSSCDSQTEPPAPAAPSASVSTPPPSAAASRPRRVRGWPVPSGPSLAILAGKGVGTIRIGATVETIQRHMDRPCDVLTEQVCRYIGRAVEFELEAGVVKAVRVHRPYRPAGGKDRDGEPLKYGFFNGRIPPDVSFGMHIAGVQMTLGKPKRIKKIHDTRFGTRELHYYPGMILEYDQLPNAPLVLGGVRIIPK